MIRIVTLNLNHRTRPKPVSVALMTALGELSPDILVFTEFVAGQDTERVLNELGSIGLPFWAMSEKVEYTRSRFQNQILMASRADVELYPTPEGRPDDHARTNFLSARTQGLSITGFRAPTYKGAQWQDYWDWLADALSGDLVIGDFNVDPTRGTKRDRVINGLVQSGGWRLAEVEGEWSYRGHTGNQSKLDHVLGRGDIVVETARYVSEPFVPNFTDHAALVVDVCPQAPT